MLHFSDFPDVEPFVVAIWSGCKKPADLNAYLDMFVKELNHLIKNGIRINDSQIKVKIRCFICDTPARCFLKGSKMIHLNESRMWAYFLIFHFK